jgi:hypothetical protein
VRGREQGLRVQIDGLSGEYSRYGRRKAAETPGDPYDTGLALCHVKVTASCPGFTGKKKPWDGDLHCIRCSRILMQVT